jgi:hypothetical protein
LWWLSSIHKKPKYRCKDCKGNSRCEHNKRKDSCNICQGNQFCEHKRLKAYYIECNGSQICEHKKIKAQCKECKGTTFCEHNSRRCDCIICTPERGCQNYLGIYVAPSSRFKPYCFKCYCVLNPDMDIPRRYKLREHYVKNELKEHIKYTKLIFDKMIEGRCSRRRPDVKINKLTHTVIVETDKFQHSYNDYSCTNKRNMENFSRFRK